RLLASTTDDHKCGHGDGHDREISRERDGYNRPTVSSDRPNRNRERDERQREERVRRKLHPSRLCCTHGSVVLPLFSREFHARHVWCNRARPLREVSQAPTAPFRIRRRLWKQRRDSLSIEPRTRLVRRTTGLCSSSRRALQPTMTVSSSL